MKIILSLAGGDINCIYYLDVIFFQEQINKSPPIEPLEYSLFYLARYLALCHHHLSSELFQLFGTCHNLIYRDMTILSSHKISHRSNILVT